MYYSEHTEVVYNAMEVCDSFSHFLTKKYLNISKSLNKIHVTFFHKSDDNDDLAPDTNDGYSINVNDGGTG